MAARHRLTDCLDHSQFENKEGYLTCSRCMGEKETKEFGKDSSKARGYSYICKSCKSSLSKSYPKPSKELVKERNQKNYAKHKEKRIAATRDWLSSANGRAKAMFSNIRLRASERGLDYSIGVQDILDLFEKQEMKCALSGIPFCMDFTKPKAYGPSIDRIDCTKGYHKDNIRLVLFAVNVGLSNFGTDVYTEICRSVANNLEN